MPRSIALASLGLALAFTGAALVHPEPNVLLAVAAHGVQKLAAAVATMTFAVAALIEHDR